MLKKDATGCGNLSDSSSVTIKKSRLGLLDSTRDFGVIVNLSDNLDVRLVGYGRQELILASGAACSQPARELHSSLRPPVPRSVSLCP